MSNRSKWDDPAAIPSAVDAEITSADRRARLRMPLLLAAPVVLLIAILYFYLTGGRYESTDNSSLQTGQVAITANVSGTVIAVNKDPAARIFDHADLGVVADAASVAISISSRHPSG